MKRLLFSIFLSMTWLLSYGQGTVSTYPTLTGTNSSTGITFSVSSTTPAEITGMTNQFSTASSCNIWVKVGGAGTPPGTISAANGWTQVVTGATVTTGAPPAAIPFGGVKINIPANTPVGIHIQAVGGNTNYRTGVSGDQVIFTDGTFTVNVADSVAYGGHPTPGFNPRRFLGSVTYALAVTGNCTPFTNFQIDSISADAAKVNWTPGSGNTGYKLEYGAAGFTPGSGTTVTGTYPTTPATPPVILTGLTANTNYDVYLEEYCAGPDTVAFPTPQSFTTTKLCAAPTAFTDSNLTSNSVDLGWMQAGSYSAGWIMWGPAGTTPGSAGWNVDTIQSPLTTHTINGLSPSTAYDIYLATDCGAINGVSDTVGPISITTPIQGPQGLNCTTGSPGVLFADDFETQGGWTGDIGTSASNWNYNTGGTGSTGTGPSGAHSGQTYIYTETSGTGSGASIEAISPRIDLSTSFNSAELSFWLHAFGVGIDTIRVQVGSSVNGPWSTVFTNVGQIQTANNDPWQNVGVNLDAYVGSAIHLRFEVIHGSGFTGDVGIDLVEVSSCQTCPFPGGMGLSFIGSDSANVSWSGSGLKYDVNWGPAGFTQGSPASNFDSTNVNSIGLGGLSGNTAYDVYIRNNCTDSANGTSGWIGPFTFATLCNPFTAPYFNNFDNDSLNEAPICWDNAIIGGTSATIPNADVESNTNAYSSPNLVRLYNYNTDTTMLMSPQFSDMSAGDKRINFFAMTTTTATGNDLEIGTMATPGDRSSYVAIDTITLTNSMAQYFIELTTANGYNGTHEFVALRHIGPTFRTYYIDDFTYEQIPLCNPPLLTSLGVSGVGVNTAVGTWASGSDGDATIIEWGNTGFTAGSGSGIGRDTVGGNVDMFTMTGLSAQTTYDFYIADSCSASGLSPWIGPFTFTTACNVLNAPFLENFDGSTWVASGSNLNNVLDPCWSSDPDVSNGSEPFKWIPRSTGPSSGNGPLNDLTGGNFMYVEASGSSAGDSAFLYSPLINVSTLTAPALYFWQHRFYTTTSTTGLADMRIDVTNDFGGSWTTVYNTQGNLQTSNSAPWEDEFVNLPQYVGDTIQIRFVQIGQGCCGDAAIDSVAINEAPSCPDPSILAATGISDTSANFSWVSALSAQNNEFWFGPAGFYQGTTTTTGTKVNVGTNSTFNVDTLDPQTCYEFLVRTACGPGDTSMWVGPISFCTQCAAISAPHYENWDNLVSASKDLGCYSSIEGLSLQGSNFLGVTIQNSTTYAPPSAPNYVEFDNSSNVTDPLIMVSPLTNDMTAGDKRVRFQLRDASTANTAELMIGTMSDPSNAATFNPLDTIDPSTTWVEYTVNLDAANGYNGTDSYFAFAHDLNGTFDYIFIDEVRYEAIPTCIRPNAVTVGTGITDTSATISWTGAGTGSNFEMEYGVGPLGDPGNTRMLVNSSSVNLTGLTPGSGYCVWVREICTPGDTSYWAGPTCFTTLCPLSGYMAPYFTNFEGISIGTASGTPAGWENCWTHNTVTGSVRWESEDASGANENSLDTGPFYDNTFHPNSGGTYMYLETSTSGGPAELISPLIDISSLNNPELYFHYHMYGATINKLLVFAEDASGTRTLLDSIGGQQQTSGADTFRIRNVSLLGLTGSTYNFVFQGHRGTSFTGDISIDDVGVDEGVSCPAPNTLSQTASTLNSATVTWSAGGGTSWIIEYGPTGFSRGSGTTATVSSLPYTINGLTAATSYDYYVRAICAPGDTSGWSGVGIAATDLCNASSQCTFNFDLTDTFGDGWNGAEITIYQNGVEVGKLGSNFTTGTLFQDSIDLCNGLNTSVVLTTAGGWPSEVGIVVYDPNGATLATYTASGTTAQGDTLASFSANCGFPCPDPVSLAATNNVGCDSIEVDWMSSTGGSILEYGPSGFTPGNGTMTGVVTPPYTITGLNANTAYDIYVADTCSGDTSNFISTGVTTANAPTPSAAFTYNSSINGNQFILYVDASATTGANSYSWDFGNGVTGSGMMDTVIFLGNGQYTVLLTVTNACGTDTISQVVNVNIGLEDNPLSNSLNVYPNPANHKVNVSFREVGSSDVNIILRDAQGRAVISIDDRMESGKFSKDINVSDLARGIYMVEVKSGGLTAHRRLSIR